jgi:hypothetical protein
MNTLSKSIINLSIALALTASVTSAHAELSKDQVKEQAVQKCEVAAKQRYGKDAIKSISDKAKWKKGLNGAAVKLKVKPKSKSSSKFLCVFKQDETVTFYKN